MRPEAKLIIGGTNNGREITVLHGRRLSIPRLRSVNEGRSENTPTALDDDREFYRMLQCQVQGEVGAFWVPEELTDQEALELVRDYFMNLRAQPRRVGA